LEEISTIGGRELFASLRAIDSSCPRIRGQGIRDSERDILQGFWQAGFLELLAEFV